MFFIHYSPKINGVIFAIHFYTEILVSADWNVSLVLCVFSLTFLYTDTEGLVQWLCWTGGAREVLYVVPRDMSLIKR